MGPWGVIRERSCRQAADSCRMSGGDLHSLSWDLVCVKDLSEWQWFIPAAIKEEAMSNCWSPAYLPWWGPWKHQGKLSKGSLNEISCEIQKQPICWHRWETTCSIINTSVKKILRSNNTTLYRQSTRGQKCEILCMQFAPLPFTTSPFTDSLLCA